MHTSLPDAEHLTDASWQQQQQQRSLLELALQLDRFGREAESFLIRQLTQLEHCYSEFEQEKAAWRRQLRRDMTQLARQREELEALRAGTTGIAPPVMAGVSGKSTDETEAAAQESGSAPIRLLLQPCRASALQVGVLFFEVSKLYRDLGGCGVQFDVSEVRLPKRRLLNWTADSEAGGEIYEFHGFPVIPLKARGSHVALDVDVSERLDVWVAFKTRLLQTTLGDGTLAELSRKSVPVRRSSEMRSFIVDATRPPARDDARNHTRYAGSAGFATSGPATQSPLDHVHQQIARLETCLARMHQDTGLKAQIEL